MSAKIRVIFFTEEDSWIAQGLEHDICVQAPTLDDAYGRFEVALRLEKDNRGNLDHIAPAPPHFQNLWDKRSGDYRPKSSHGDEVECGVAA